MNKSEPVLLDVWAKRQRKGDPPFPPVLHLVPKTHGPKDGRLTIGPNMMFESDVDDLFDTLQQDLERARAKAKRELRKGK